MVWNVACTAILVALLSYVLLLVARYTLGYHFSKWKFWTTTFVWATNSGQPKKGCYRWGLLLSSPAFFSLVGRLCRR